MNERGSSIVHSQSHRCSCSSPHTSSNASFLRFCLHGHYGTLIWYEKQRDEGGKHFAERIKESQLRLSFSCLHVFYTFWCRIFLCLPFFLFFSKFQKCGSFGSKTEKIFMFWCSLLCDFFPLSFFIYSIFSHFSHQSASLLHRYSTSFHPSLPHQITTQTSLLHCKLSVYFIISLHFWHRLTFTVKSLPMQHFYTATKQCNTQAKYSL